MIPGSKFEKWFGTGVIFVLTVIAYFPAWHGAFLWDDSVMVYDNPMLRSAQGLRDFWLTTRAVDPLPVTMSALWLQWQCWGLHTLGYHFVGILLHASASVLFWRLLVRFGLRTGPAWVAAAAFALHPVAVASVAWISEQKNTLSILFYFLSLLFYFQPARRDYVLSLVFFACALLSKGSVVMLPVILLLVVWWQARGIAWEDILKAVPFFALSALDAIYTIWIQNHKAIGGSMVQNLSGLWRVAAAGQAVCFYAWKDLLPLRLSVIYPPLAGGWRPLTGLVALFVVAAVNYKKPWGRVVLFGLGCFVVTLFPVMGFFNMYFLSYSRVADHWQYPALPALLALAVGGAAFLLEKYRLPKSIGVALSIAMLMTLFAATWSRAAVYASEKTLWSDTVEKNPDAWMAWNNLGNACAAEHQDAAAIVAYEKAIEKNPSFPDAESNLGNALVAKGDLPGALEHLQRAVEGEPRMAKFHFNYGVGLAAAGRADEAIAQYNQALALRSDMADVRNNLANLFFKRRQYAEALEQVQIALQIDSTLAEPYFNFAKILAALNRTNEAAQNFETYLRMRPNDASAHFEYGLVLATHGDLTGALPHFQAIVRLKPDEPVGHGSLGNTLAGLKRLDEAVTEFRIAAKLAPNDAQNENNLANALAEQGNVDEAIQHYEIAVKQNNADAATHVNYALALFRRGRRDDAIRQLREAQRLEPGNPAIQQQLDAVLRQ